MMVKYHFLNPSLNTPIADLITRDAGLSNEELCRKHLSVSQRKCVAVFVQQQEAEITFCMHAKVSKYFLICNTHANLFFFSSDRQH